MDLGRTWENKCSTQFDLDKNETLKRIVTSTMGENFKNHTVKQALGYAYNGLDKLIDPQPNPNVDCSNPKILLFSSFTSLLKVGTGLLAAAGPPLASLGSLLATGPITKLIQNSVNGSQGIKDFNQSLIYVSEKNETPLNFYTCALYAVQKARCNISQKEYCSLENDQTKIAAFITPLKNILEFKLEESSG